MKRLTTPSASLLCAVTLLLPATLRSQGTPADYARAASLPQRTRNLVYGGMGTPTWIDSSGTLWFSTPVKGGTSYLVVEAATSSKRPAFDHVKLAASLAAATDTTYTALTLPLAGLTFSTDLQAIEFNARNQHWRCTLTDYRCTATGAVNGGRGGSGGRGGAAQGGRGGAGGGRGGATADGSPVIPTRVSPDGKREVSVQSDNIMVRQVGDTTWQRLSFDGAPGSSYRYQSLAWSPDSKRLIAFRVRPVVTRQVTYVESSPIDQLQPKTSFLNYAKPGDILDVSTPVVFDMNTNSQRDVDNSLFPNPYSVSRMEWRRDSKRFTFEYNQRGHQLYRVIEVDATTATARVLIDEPSATFFQYRDAVSGLTDTGERFRRDINDGAEILWMSPRDGWKHLYLIDGVTGAVKHQITKGNWLVRSVERVDTTLRQIWFTAGGAVVGQDPYLLHFYRINFDGSGLTPLTSADGTHTITYSPDRRYYIDTWQRVDLPPISELRRTVDQQLVLELARADASALLKTGWRYPEVFTAKARDGVTDIWGIVIRPTNFDPKKKYPVIENIYAGPQGSFVPKTFSTQTGMQALAELGFVVVQIDGMGTANRSKAFHNVAWQNLADAGFPDRILWHKAVATKYPWYDATRVGIYGTSAGGQNALGALLFHPEFYAAAYAASGSHDNRMDKIWWNELWMGWPIGPQYAASSNVDNAYRLQGKLLIVAGELDNNVDPSSTLQVVNALIKANKMFDFLYIPGAGHTSGGAYGDAKRNDFFVHALMGVETVNRNLPKLADSTDKR